MDKSKVFADFHNAEAKRDESQEQKTEIACMSLNEEELLLHNEYLVTENRIWRNQFEGRVPLTDAERQSLAEIGKKLGKQALKDIATIVKPDTILAWHCKLVAQEFDGSEQRKAVGRPRVDKVIEDLVVQMAGDRAADKPCAVQTR